jgi:hypothetical protein
VFIGHRTAYFGNQNSIVVEADTKGEDIAVVPQPSTVLQTVKYPDPPWEGLRYPDGYSLQKMGQTEVPAGEPVTIEQIGPPAREKRVDVSYGSTPNGATGFDWERTYSADTEEEALVLRETTGNAAVTLDWSVFNRRRS